MNKTVLSLIIVMIAIGSFAFFGVKVYAPLPSYTDEITQDITTEVDTATPTADTTTTNATETTASTPATSTNSIAVGEPNPATPQPTTAGPKPTAPTSSTSAKADVEVEYTDSGFTPKTITIKAGQSVRFLNTSNKLMWVSSDPHPTHTDYPGFDQLTAVAKGKDYLFVFTQAGTWGYHNHLGASHAGTVVVQ